MKGEMNGGKTIASGGFGCVFRPSLKCHLAKERESNKISKLMTSRHALGEYNEVVRIKHILNKIPNYKDYFIIHGVTICQPDKLSKSDLLDFKKCTALPKDNILANNINKSLDKLLLLNIPDGGEAFDDFLYAHSSYHEILQINKALIDLFLNGIVPMNKLNVYHSDLKDSNLLISRDSISRRLQIRLIDWGLTVIYNPKKNDGLPRNWKNRPLQFNVPFSSILFSDTFSEKYSTFLNKSSGGGGGGAKFTRAKLIPFVTNYISEWNESRGPGHLKYITHIFFMFFEKDHPIESRNNNNKFFEETYTIPYITNYIVKILMAFKPLKNSSDMYIFTSHRMPLQEYLDQVFVKNVDIWGLLMCYYPIIEIIYDNYKTSSPHDLKIFNHIKSLYLNVLYKNGDKVISVSKILKEMNKISTLFNHTHAKTMRKHNSIILSNKSRKSMKSTKHQTSRKLKDLDF